MRFVSACQSAVVAVARTVCSIRVMRAAKLMMIIIGMKIGRNPKRHTRWSSSVPVPWWCTAACRWSPRTNAMATGRVRSERVQGNVSGCRALHEVAGRVFRFSRFPPHGHHVVSLDERSSHLHSCTVQKTYRTCLLRRSRKRFRNNRSEHRSENKGRIRYLFIYLFLSSAFLTTETIDEQRQPLPRLHFDRLYASNRLLVHKN